MSDPALLYLCFDAIVGDDPALCKVETVQDTFMVACGLLDTRDSTPADQHIEFACSIVRALLDVADAVAEFAAFGPEAPGVVEGRAAAAHQAQLQAHEFAFVDRGSIGVKGKGMMLVCMFTLSPVDGGVAQEGIKLEIDIKNLATTAPNTK
ncbi:hypothetical protein GGF32_008007 [Allomyces javanicus]|nr:hypothetical protein GGF32_008007 [Allomyces javanicus]